MSFLPRCRASICAANMEIIRVLPEARDPMAFDEAPCLEALVVGLVLNGMARLPGSEQLTGDERDRLIERGAARTGVTHLGVLVPDRHAAEKDQPVRE